MFTFSKKRALLIAAGGTMMSLIAAGCSHQDDATPPQVNTTTTVVPPPAVAPGAATTTTVPGPSGTVTSVTPSTNNTNAGSGGATGSQTLVADAVNKAIHNNAQMTGSRVTAVVDAAGTASLTGTAQNAQQKGLAELTARQTAGVSHVKNKIEIVPTGGAKSASKPSTVTKTKIIVVHDKSSAAPAAPADQSAPASTSDTNSSATNASGGTAAGTDTAAPPASSTDSKGQ